MVGPETTLIGRTLAGRYTPEELIGRGRGSLVFRARDAQAGTEVALKVLAAPRSPEARERYRRVVAGEVGVASALRSPHVLAVHALGYDPELEVDFVTSELARGQTLASVLASRGKPPIALGLRLLQDAAEGLAAAHRAGLVHRDLRPASLYLVRSDAERQVRVKLGGFGVPQIVRAESLAGAPPEVSGYASPEMLAAGSARLTPASDVFSLGAIGFELMTGALPLDEAARRALAAGGRVEIEPPVDVAAAVPPHVLDAVLQALRIGPAERFADAAAFADALLQRTASPAPVAVPVAIVDEPPEIAASERTAPASVDATAAMMASAAVLSQHADAPAASSEPSIDPAASMPDPEAAPIAPVAAADSGRSTEPGAVPAPEAAAPSEPATAAGSSDRILAFAGRVLPGETVPEFIAPESPDAAPESPSEGASPIDSETPAASAAASADPSAASRTHIAPLQRAVPADLELYYPPQSATPPAAAVGFASAASAAAGAGTPGSGADSFVVAAAPGAASIPVAPAAPSLVPPAEAFIQPLAAQRALSLGGARKGPARTRTVRGPAMAAGFVLGILVLGSAGWIATRRSGAAPAPAAHLPVNRLASGAPAAATPADPPDARPAPAAAAPAAGDTSARAVAARRRAQEEAKKRQQQDEERKRLQDEQVAPVQPQEQQRLALAQQAVQQQPLARPQTVTPPVQQPVAVVPRPAAPPPAPPAAAPAREEPAPTREAASNEVFSVGDVEERPRLSNGAEIQRALQSRYPEQLSAAHVSGSVTATFVVNADGRVDGSTIRIVSSPNPGFNVPTQNVLRRARFRPATVRGQPVRVQVTMPVQWTATQ